MANEDTTRDTAKERDAIIADKEQQRAEQDQRNMLLRYKDKEADDLSGLDNSDRATDIDLSSDEDEGITIPSTLTPALVSNTRRKSSRETSSSRSRGRTAGI